MQESKLSLAIKVLRIAVALNMFIHGTYRLSIGGVTPFDGYLHQVGFPSYTAWIITFFEIIASVLLIAGKWVTPIALVFAAELVMGIVLVHSSAGWFVVGGGRNGMEYSVLMIVCFGLVAYVNWGKSR